MRRVVSFSQKKSRQILREVLGSRRRYFVQRLRAILGTGFLGIAGFLLMRCGSIVRKSERLTDLLTRRV